MRYDSSYFQAMINAMKEVFESGHVHHERGARRVLPEGGDSDGNSLLSFMHATARDKLLPLLGANCRTMNAKVTRHAAGEDRAQWFVRRPRLLRSFVASRMRCSIRAVLDFHTLDCRCHTTLHLAMHGYGYFSGVSVFLLYECLLTLCWVRRMTFVTQLH